MKRKHIFIITIIGILAILILAGWVFIQTSLRERGFLTGLPCSLPCWQGISPGITGSTDAIKILQKISSVKQTSVKLSGTTNSGGCTWQWRISGKRTLPGMTWENGIVNTITLGLNFDLSIKEVIDKFGLPDSISTIKGGTPEYWYWILTMYYPGQGIEFKAFTPEFQEQMEPSTEIGIVSMFTPKSMDERSLEIQKQAGGYLPENFLNKWQGYGNISELYGKSR